MRKKSIIIFLIFINCFPLVCCRSYRLKKSLSPDEKEFISKVRFIITKEERKIFLRLPSSEREAFIEDFWAKRDPDPETEENEYKEEYYFRIEEANRYFRGEGTAGWLTDRGRIFILFGPPHSRKIYPADAAGGLVRAREVWYYGNYPVIFIDRYNSGVYTLEMESVVVLNEINFALRQVRKELKEQIKESEKFLLDFSLELDESSNIPVILIKVPYKNIWFVEKENILETILNLALIILDSDKNVLLQHDDDYFISLTEKSLESKIDENYVIEVPLVLAKGEYLVQATLTNKTGDKKVYREFIIKV